MDTKRRQYGNYYKILPEEIPRDIFVLFNDNPQNSYAKCLFDTPFDIGLGSNGKRNVGLSVTHFTALHTVMNVSAQNHTNRILIGESIDSAEEILLRDAFYESLRQIILEVQKSPHAGDFRMETDHLGLCTYSGTKDLFIPMKIGDALIPDTLAHKFGFANLHGVQIDKDDSDDRLITHPTGSKNVYLNVKSGDGSVTPGDLFGPLSDILLTCDQCIWTKETDRVLQVFSIAAFPARAHCTWHPTSRFRPLHDIPHITRLDLRLVDRNNRHVQFVSGVPSATLELMHLN